MIYFNYFIFIFGRVIADNFFGNKHVYFHNGQTPLAASARATFVFSGLLAFPSALFDKPFHIDNRTVANCGIWLEYASKTPPEVVADLPRWMRLFLLRCQIMRIRSVHIKPHYSQNAFDSALLAWYERGISFIQTIHAHATCRRKKKSSIEIIYKLDFTQLI